MANTSETIVFFGSGPVAAESLRLLSKDFTIEAVVTKPRPEHHRGTVPVVDLAEKLGLPVKTAATSFELDKLFTAHTFTSRAAILVDFGIIVSQTVIDSFPLGIINSHFSVLPEWRGADPITFAVLSGQPQTGVSLMLLVAAMDEGPLLAYGEYDMPADITTPQLTDDLVQLSYVLLREMVPQYLSGNLTPALQDITGREVSYSRRLVKEDGLIDWHKPAQIIEREIRAYTGWPQSRTRLGPLDVIITKARVTHAHGTPGEATTLNKKLVVFCGEQALEIENVKPAGKKEMTGEAFLAGYKHLLD